MDRENYKLKMQNAKFPPKADQPQAEKKLETILKKLGSAVVAYSGGMDSSFLLKAASRALGKDNVLAVTVCSETYTKTEHEHAKKLARDFGVKHLSIKAGGLNIKKFRENFPNRCYYCKRDLFSRLKKIADKNDLKFIVEGSTLDDLNDFRPGMKAIKELKVRSPLKEACLTKNEIRKFSRKLRLGTWSKPPGACLASRFPYGDRITKKKLKQVEEAEAALRKFGFTQVRVRHYGKSARIEVGEKELSMFFKNGLRAKVISKLKKLGFVYTALDLEGYRTGSMNEELKQAV